MRRALQFIMDNNENSTAVEQENGENLENGSSKRVRSRSELLKRKQKRTVENLKGFGRKGIFGRGTELDAEEGNYFMKISEAIKEDYDTTEDKRE